MIFEEQDLAKLEYTKSDYLVLKSGKYVKCAVTGEKIKLDALKYWNFERQEPYTNAQVMMQREIEVRK